MALQSTPVKQRRTFSRLLLLPLEIRVMIYQNILSQQTIVLRDRIATPIKHRENTWIFYLENTSDTDFTKSLLQLCKQVFNEVTPLLQQYPASHLVLSKGLRGIPRSTGDVFRSPFAHITRLTFSVKKLGPNRRADRTCPGLRPSPANVIMWSCCGEGPGFVGNTPPPEPGRFPDLQGLGTLSPLVGSLPALREVHIYDILKHSLLCTAPCRCPIADTQACSCGACQCDCISHPQLPSSRESTVAQAERFIHEALLSRYRAALPKWNRFESTNHCVRPYSTYFAFLDLLAHGTHVFLHDEITITAPLDINSGRMLHKGHWSATFSVAPPDDAKAPADPPTIVPSEEFNVQHRRNIQKSFIGDRYFTNFPMEAIRDLPDGCIEQPDLFDSLQVQILDRDLFDRVIEKSVQEDDTKLKGTVDSSEKRETHWRWG